MSQTATRRLLKEYKKLQSKPVPNIITRPSKGNMLKWYFMLHSMQDDYKDGIYIGKIVFPSDYPFKPPDILFLTPNGRFETNKKICLSFTSYHPESWNPNWTMENMLLGVLSFMYDDKPTTGSISTSSFTKRKYARGSISFNLGIPEFKDIFMKDFVELGIDLDAAIVKAKERIQNGGGGFDFEALTQSREFVILVLIVAAVIGWFYVGR